VRAIGAEAQPAPSRSRGGLRVRELVTSISPAFAAALITLAFVLITEWWLTQDSRVPEFDPGLHASFAFQFHDQISDGHLLAWFNDWTQYPPLVHTIGAVATFIAGKDIWPGVMAENVIFVPLLAAGCYGAARIVYKSDLAGLLAVIFALGTPMIVSQFHEFMIDAPETALLAASIWLILASGHFERVGMSAWAGAAVGFGLLTKESFPAFIAGVVIVAAVYAVMRRNWRGLAVFAAVAIVIALPWYIRHWDQVQHLRHIASQPGTDNSAGGSLPQRYSAKNAGWFLWSGLNIQNFAPLLAFAAVGIGMAIVRLFKRPWREPLTLELLVGGLIAWAGATYSLPHDPRYSLPGLPYLAVLGAGWIVLLRPARARLVAALALSAIALVNVLTISFGLGHRVAISLPGAPKNSGLYERQLTLISDHGFAYGKPERSGDLLGLMRDLHHRNIRYVLWDLPAANSSTFNTEGLTALAQIARLQIGRPPPAQRRDGVILVHLAPGQSKVPPCRRLYDGTDVYVFFATQQPLNACPL
jgi:hypothetical protein